MQANSYSTEAPVERRRQPRLNFTEPIQFRDLLKASALFYGSLARDLSAGGLRIRSYTPMAKGDRLLLLLEIPDFQRVVRAIAQVVWQSQRPFDSGYETGLQFIEVAPEDRDSIAGFVERGVVS
jgi:Tfp pilus assembly protein PilZ